MQKPPPNPKPMFKPVPVVEPGYTDLHGPMFAPPGPATAAQILAATQAAATVRARSNASAPPPQSPAPSPAAGLAAAHASAAAGHMPKVGAKPPPAAGSGGGGAAGFSKPSIPVFGGGAAAAAASGAHQLIPVRQLIQTPEDGAEIVELLYGDGGFITGPMGGCASVIVLWQRANGGDFTRGRGHHASGGALAMNYQELFRGISAATPKTVIGIYSIDNDLARIKQALDDLGIQDVQIVKSSNAFVARDGSIKRSEDGGLKWIDGFNVLNKEDVRTKWRM